MSALTRYAGMLVGLSTVAAIGIAGAQGHPPNPLIADPALGAGQQSTHLTPMGETGVLAHVGERPMAAITPQPEVAQAAPEPAPAPASEPVATAPEPEPVAAAPVTEPAPTQSMGAPAAQPMTDERAPRADRN